MLNHPRAFQTTLSVLVTLFLLIGSAAIPAPAYAASTITVATSADELNNNGFCSLREAITNANADAQTYNDCVGGSGNDTIQFNDILGTATITLGSSLPNITDTDGLTINGGGDITVSGNNLYRITIVNSSVPLTLDGLTVINAKPASTSGGAIINAGTLIITNSTFSGNSSTNSGGGISNNGTLTITNSTFSGNSATYGGGIFNSVGTLTITNSTFSGNSIVGGLGGGINNTGGTLTITNSTFSGNTTNVDYAGAIFSDGTMHLKNTILANSGFSGDCYNSGTIATDVNNLIEINGYFGNYCGTPVLTSDPQLGPLADNGGTTQTFALLPSSPALGAGANTVCDDNPGPNNLDQRGVTRPQGGNCDIGAYESNAQPGPTLVVNTDEDSTDGFCDAYVAGVTDCTLREAITYANSTSGTWTITFAANYIITLGNQLPAVTGTIIINGNGAANTIIQANAAPNIVNYRPFAVNAGGDLTLDQLKVRNGRTPFGGGISNSGTLSITNSVLSNNMADSNGGHIYNSSTGILSINNTTISGDAALFSDAGGGVFNDGGKVTVRSSTIQNNYTNNAGAGLWNETGSTFTITNSTITGNHASGNVGGGILTRGTMKIYSSTISGNTGTTGDNIYNQTPGTLNLYNTIVANSGGNDDCVNTGTFNATNSLIQSTGVQACGLVNGSDGNIIGSDPALGSLTGTPEYLPFSSGSPAVDAGNDAICAAEPVSNTSQNGVTRPLGSHCDIGSYEFDPPMYKLFLPLLLR